MSRDDSFLELLRRRTSIETFDPTRPLDEVAIRELVSDAICTPSSFNIQHWRFVAVTDDAEKQSLCEAAYGQRQVVDAAVTFIVLGDLLGLEKLPEINKRAVECGALPEGKAQAWERLAQEIYGSAAAARDEAMRSGSLASMTLMLAAEARGYASGALSGFDPQRLCRSFDIDDRYLPVLLVAVGYPKATATTRQPRLDVDEVLSFNRARRY